MKNLGDRYRILQGYEVQLNRWSKILKDFIKMEEI